MKYALDAGLLSAHKVDMTTFDPNIGKATRWRKGQPSPNPGGRPKTRLLSQALKAKLAEMMPGDPERRTFAEVLAANLVELACSKSRNSVAAITEIGNRTEGKAAMSLAFTDLTADLESRSDDELNYFLANGSWPEGDEAQLQ